MNTTYLGPPRRIDCSTERMSLSPLNSSSSSHLCCALTASANALCVTAEFRLYHKSASCYRRRFSHFFDRASGLLYSFSEASFLRPLPFDSRCTLLVDIFIRNSTNLRSGLPFQRGSPEFNGFIVVRRFNHRYLKYPFAVLMDLIFFGSSRPLNTICCPVGLYVSL